ncbi:MFS transporter [Companilactobacillus sp. HBUAS59544]|uniref:MFS transporter n=1 Tax=Companilactobacillus sp. HBUAS59544 TaxID=3109363 RepID=UPI002FF41B37
MNKKKIPLVLGILSMNLLLMSTSAVSAAIAAIAKSFPKEPISKVQMIGSIPQFGQLIATIIFSYLAFKLTRKNLGLLAVAVVGVAGLLPVFYSSSLNLILACMILVGFGTGLISNVAPVLLQINFDGEERATAMGWSVGANNIGMMVFTALGGALGATDWHNLFWIYALTIVIFLMVFFLVPQDVKLAKQGNDKSEKTNFKSIISSLDKHVYLILIISFVLSLCMMIFMTNQSIVLAGKGQGTAYVAMVTAIGNIGGIIAAVLIKYIRKITKTNTIAWGFVAFVLSFVLVLFTNNIVLHILGNMFSGVGIVLVNATIPYELSVLTNEKEFTVAIAMNTFVSSVAGMFAPMIISLLHVSAGEQSFIAGAILSAAVFVILIISRFGKKIEKIGEAEGTV